MPGPGGVPNPPLVEGFLGEEFPASIEPPGATTDRSLLLALSLDLDLPSAGDCTGIIEGDLTDPVPLSDAIIEIKYHLIEAEPDDHTIMSDDSDLWTVAEVINYFNNRQHQFLRDTGLVMKRGTLLTIPEAIRHVIPSDTIAIQAAWWRDIGIEVHESLRWNELRRGDTWEADNLLSGNWPSENSASPEIYMDAEVPTLLIQTAPRTSSAGIIDLLYVALSDLFAVLTDAGAPVDFTTSLFTVPNDFIPCLKYGVMADMLSKIGRAHDPLRAAYCERRYSEGVEAAKLMLGGFA